MYLFFLSMGESVYRFLSIFNILRSPFMLPISKIFYIFLAKGGLSKGKFYWILSLNLKILDLEGSWLWEGGRKERENESFSYCVTEGAKKLVNCIQFMLSERGRGKKVYLFLSQGFNILSTKPNSI